ncbi:MAG: hypothetical protein NTU81_02160 [Candidatus Nomurabacteria bacterium]|nr:hypothetical protein [Candidatus Nomurabacteria bacterium]
MKKMFLIMLVAIATALVVSCTKDDLTQAPQEELEPHVELKVTPDNATIPYGSTVTVSWTSINAKTVTLNGEPVATNGTRTFNNLVSTTTFTALAKNVVKTAHDEKTVNIGEEPTPTATLTISSQDAIVPYGHDVTLSWNTTNANTVTLNGVPVPAIGSQTVVKLLANTTYVLRAVNITKDATSQKTVIVGDWTTSRFGLLTHAGQNWWFDKMESWGNGIVAITYYATPNNGYDVYLPNYTISNYSHNGQFLANSTQWELIENDTKIRTTFSTGSHVEVIVSLTQTDFIFREEDKNGQGTYYMRYLKVH